MTIKTAPDSLSAFFKPTILTLKLIHGARFINIKSLDQKLDQQYILYCPFLQIGLRFHGRTDISINERLIPRQRESPCKQKHPHLKAPLTIKQPCLLLAFVPFFYSPVFQQSASCFCGCGNYLINRCRPTTIRRSHGIVTKCYLPIRQPSSPGFYSPPSVTGHQHELSLAGHCFCYRWSGLSHASLPLSPAYRTGRSPSSIYPLFPCSRSRQPFP